MKQMVTLTWGAETYTPTPYNTYVVGPFSTTIEVSGESEYVNQHQIDHAYEKLKLFAEKQRLAKHQSYSQHLKTKAGV
jgi:hypothetical protein